MIISYHRRFIFAAIPKTGTHSVRQALRAQLGPDDIEQVGLFVNKHFPFPELAAIGHGHITLQQIRPYLTADQFGRFLKVAFVRNPFDRFVSYCAFMNRANDSFERYPKPMMRRILELRPMQHTLFQPQYTFVTDEKGALLADYVGRVENMQTSYDEMCRRLDMPSATLEQINSSKRGAYRDYYDQDLIDGVAALYRRDLDLFGYEF